MKYTLFQNLLPSNETQLLRRIFADLEYLGVFQKYGSYCLLMSSILAEILRDHHFEIELKACIAVIDQGPKKRFLLGAKEFSSPGQLPTHIVCVVNQTVLLDFGLGNVRRQFSPHFFRGLMLPISDYHATKGQVLCSAKVDPLHEVHYLVDEVPDMLNIEVQAQEVALQQTLAVYRRYAKNRLRFNLARVFKKVYKTHFFSQKACPELQQIAGDFSATWVS